MVTTISDTFFRSLPSKPPLKELSDLNIDINVTVANGNKLAIFGYIEITLAVPDLNFELDVPVLVVPDTGSHPVIVGTNIIRRCKSASVAPARPLPDSWQSAFDALVCEPITVKSTNEHTVELGPYESVTLNGIARGLKHDVQKIVTENISPDSPYLVRPHVLKAPHHGNYVKVPVRLCNMTAKPVLIRPKSDICVVDEVKVVDNLASSLPPSSSSSLDPVDDLGVKIDIDNLSPDQILRVRQVLGNWRHIFSTGPTDLGCSNIVKHKIVLTNDTPFKQPYRKIPPGMYEEVRQHLKDMVDCGAIRESDSPYSSNVVLVRKKDGSLRFCLDFRMLNSRTRKDAYMLPRFDDTVDTLVGSKFFSKLDLRSGY
ncbi:uncharacterized protein LOC128215224 [Mya arenaria]|uniref:uncharacterized protein LOC128215224 n=1 Tax=Mya arenaria TaxID=6604 RepID=UPI0022E4E8C5|nr:uncharacterized protein LOC128215224 [Mya arenaria]